MTEPRTIPDLDQAILNALAGGPLSTMDLVRELKEERGRVHQRLSAMLEDRLVQRGAKGPRHGDRVKGVRWRIRPGSR